MPPLPSVLRRVAVAALCIGATVAFAATKTFCTITVNSPDEKEMFRRHLPPGDYRFVELVEHGRKDWMARACRQKISCDALIISGHFDGGDEFYTDRLDTSEYLAVSEMEKASCSESCPGVFANLKEVNLFGCNTLRPDPQQHVLSNRDRLRHIFRNVPVIYGFSSKAPLGKYAGPLLEKFFQSSPADIGSGKNKTKQHNQNTPTTKTETTGITD